ADGRFLAFQSTATDLAASVSFPVVGGVFGGERASNVFVRDLQQQTTALASINPGGTSAGTNHSTNPSLSGNGRFVAFNSSAENLVAFDRNGQPDVFVRDLQRGVTLMASSTLQGGPGGPFAGNGRSFGSPTPSISADGRYVAFTSYADNLVPSDGNHVQDIFV